MSLSFSRYNRAHSKTRVVVENMFGIMKQRFPLLANGIRMKKVASSVSVVRYVTDYANLLTLGN